MSVSLFSNTNFVGPIADKLACMLINQKGPWNTLQTIVYQSPPPPSWYSTLSIGRGGERQVKTKFSLLNLSPKDKNK